MNEIKRMSFHEDGAGVIFIDDPLGSLVKYQDHLSEMDKIKDELQRERLRLADCGIASIGPNTQWTLTAIRTLAVTPRNAAGTG